MTIRALKPDINYLFGTDIIVIAYKHELGGVWAFFLHKERDVWLRTHFLEFSQTSRSKRIFSLSSSGPVQGIVSLCWNEPVGVCLETHPCLRDWKLQQG